MTEKIYNRQFVCALYWMGFAHWSLGFHVHFWSPNFEIHLPFCFIRVGWQGVYVANKQKPKFGKVYQI